VTGDENQAMSRISGCGQLASDQPRPGNCATPFRYDPRMRFVTPDRCLWPHADPRDLERWLTKVRQPEPPLGHGCILWIGAIETTAGYPRFQKGSGPTAEIVSGQRWSYQAATGIDPGERVIRHDCDIRICEHPHHHQPGTVADNVADTVARGRHANTSFGAPGRWVRFSLRLRDAVRTGDYTATAAMLATPEQLTFFNQPSTHAERP